MSTRRRLFPGLLAVAICLAGLPALAVAPDSEASPSTPPSAAPESLAVAESSADSGTRDPATDEPTVGEPDRAEANDPSSSPGALTTMTPAPPPAPAVRSRADGDPGGRDDDTSRVTMMVGTLTDSGILKGKSEYRTNEPVADVVNINISGKDYSLKNPYLQIRFPKTPKLADITVVDSQAGTTERTDDEQYHYVTYRFPSLSGGVDFTYSYSFTIDGRSAKPGDTFTVDATLYSADGKEVVSDSKTYTALGVGYTAYSQSNLTSSKIEKGHLNTARVLVTDPNATAIPDDAPVTSKLYLSIAPDNGNTTNEGLVVPTNVKMVVTLPATARIQLPGPGVTVKDLPDGRQEITFVKSHPEFKKPPIHGGQPVTPYYTQDKYVTMGEFSRFSETAKSPAPYISLLFTGSPFDTNLPVDIDYYVNAHEDGSGGTPVDSRREIYRFQGLYFYPTGNLVVEKSGVVSQGHGLSPDSDSWVSAYTGSNYYWYDGHLYVGVKDFTDPGLGYYARFGNENNGSGPTGRDRYQGGKTSSITEVVTENTNSRTRFSSFRLAPEVSTELTVNDDNRDIIEANKKIVEGGINKGNTKLYGVRADGTRQLIKENVQLGDNIPVGEQTEGEFTKLVLTFDNPVIFDNTLVEFRTFSALTSAENERLTVSPAFDPYTIRESVTVNGVRQSATVDVNPLRPTVDQNQPKDVAKIYQMRNDFTLTVGPDLRQLQTQGPFTVIRNMRTVTLLPVGVGYDGSSRDFSPNLNIRTVANYHGTGQTAVVVDYGNMRADETSFVDLKLHATAATASGPNAIPTYLVWDSNDKVKPAYSPYTDALDLDEDGDTTEVFQVKTATLTFTPPQELSLVKQATVSGITSGEVTGDLGSDLSYQLLVYNGTQTPVKALTLVDVLPYEGDHTIVPSAAGTYPQRGSTFAAGLTGSLEDANTPEVNAKFAFSYQLAPQGTDLASVRDGEWVPANHVTDFSHVKSVRAILKDGQQIPANTNLAIIIPSRTPTDTSLKDPTAQDPQTSEWLNPDKSVNTAAFSTNGQDFTEATSVTVMIQKYRITGIYFADIDGNSVFTNGTDRPIGGRQLQIVDANGNPAKDPSGQALPPVVTNADGYYSAPVYARGTYRVVASKESTEDFVTTPGTSYTGNNNIDGETIVGNTAKTTSVKLTPLSPTRELNVAVRLIPGTVTIMKTSEAEDGAAAAPLADAVFRIIDADDQQIRGTDGKIIEDVTTNAQGKATLNNVPLGSYRVVEVKAPQGYVLSTVKHDVTLTRDNTDVTIAVENSRDHASVKVSKVWEDADNKDGIRPDSVTVRLLANGEETGKTLTLTAKDTWAGVFAGLDTNTAGKEIQYTVVEDPVKGYDTAVTGSAGDGYTVTNTLIHGNITLTKVSDTGTPLAGAVFELRRHDGHVADTQTTSKDGTLVFTRVAYGKYTVVETRAPKGYRNTTQVLSAQITTHGETVDLGTVVNKKIPTLAHTGTNTLITGTLGASLLVLGTLLIQRGRRRMDAELF
ncbi:SpaA isopeptide-forming pilin-related protein [Schaalia sp. ZJ1691]|uniref:SpaA isopeptide-forming pilin-related protein n=1 Tax=Schaalia sp. ZJ1691 TaxID=2709404 RepID=UPI0013ED05E2|nr:SpaA isopeptide-forming pilin-related protein [Schaalia sp. ZJ1691]